MASKVFISWGGDLSKMLAEEIKNWLPSVLQFVKPYFTPDDVEKGTRWENSIAQELESSNIGVICLTRDNINRPWILFEAGALSKNLDKSKVCTILFNVESSDIVGPLTCFQSTKFDKTDFRKLISTINDTGAEYKLSPSVLNDVFEMWWPRLEEKIKSIISNYRAVSQEEERTDREILDELLALTRMTASRIPRRSPNSRHALGTLIHWFDRVTLRMMNARDNDYYRTVRDLFNDELFESLEVLCFEYGESISYIRDIKKRMFHGLI